MIGYVGNMRTGVYSVREIDLAGYTMREVSSTTIEQQLRSLGYNA